MSFNKDTCLWSMEETREAEMERMLLESFESSPVVRVLRSITLPYKATASEIQQEIKDKGGTCCRVPNYFIKVFANCFMKKSADCTTYMQKVPLARNFFD